MKKCKDITMLVSAAQDRDLSRWEGFGLKFHLLMCKHCRNYSDSVGQLRTMMDSYADLEELPPQDEALSSDGKPPVPPVSK